jgi:DNA invertase Pin-like site-specific DNA recombinase
MLPRQGAYRTEASASLAASSGEPWSMSTPAGRALFQMLIVFAEFERSIIQERIIAGIASALAQGTRSGKAFGPTKALTRAGVPGGCNRHQKDGPACRNG